MSGKDLKEAAAKIEARKKLLKEPVIKRPDDPENIHLSKEQFIAKRRKEKEDSVEKEKVWQEHLAKKRDKNVVQEKGQETPVVKKGRPKRVE